MPSFACRSAGARLLRRHRRRGLCKHGTTPTRLIVIDKRPADDPAAFPVAPALPRTPHAAGLARRSSADSARRRSSLTVPTVAASALAVRGYINQLPRPSLRPCRGRAGGPPLAYETQDGPAGEDGRLSDGIYEEYGSQAIRIAGSGAPTRLVQSAAMASVAHLDRAIGRTSGQYPRVAVRRAARDRHLCRRGSPDHLAGSWTVDATFDVVTAARRTNAARFRCGHDR